MANSTLQYRSTHFEVMGCRASVAVSGARPSTLDWARQRLDDLERLWSRFIPESDISRMNRSHGPIHVAAETIVLIQAMKVASEVGEGRFDPTMLRQIIDLGYDHALGHRHKGVALSPGPAIDVDIEDFQIDPVRNTVATPPTAGLDPGGIGKGLAADLVSGELVAAGAAGALVNIGGDLAATGIGPLAGRWPIEVTDADRLFVIDAGGVATSSTMQRTFRGRHHVLDPRTGTSAVTDVKSATVIAASAALAEVHAKAVLIGGYATAVDYLITRDLSGLVVGTNGRVGSTPDLESREL